ncbi:PIN domain nuclease [Nevskia sp.]|uniref:type II toxin-antitoxin system VapC family toxin n=1 Tax=Nevskia sp. TaxID=1929292 RepID=UPI0034585D4A
MIVADSSVWIDFLNGVDGPQVELLDQLLDRDTVVTGDLILTEVLQGIRDDREFRRVSSLMAALPSHEMAGFDIALRSAQNYRRLRAQGITVRKTIDLLIGTFCIEHGLTLLHRDRDFDAMEQGLGLKVLRAHAA